MDGINPFIAGCTYLSELGPLPNLPWTPLEALKYKLEISVVTTSAQGMDGCVYVDQSVDAANQDFFSQRRSDVEPIQCLSLSPRFCVYLVPNGPQRLYLDLLARGFHSSYHMGP